MSTLLASQLTTGLTAGESLAATVAFDDYPASSGYTCRYEFAGPSTFYAETTVSTDSYVLAVHYDVTAELAPGLYSYVGYVTATATDIRYKADSGTIRVKFNPARKTRARVILDAVEALMEGRASDDQRTTKLGEVELQFMTPGDLMKWRNYWRQEVSAEISSAQQGEGAALNTIRTRFTNPV
jgi:hypothetical protein